jgi:hypothetical protein
MQTRKGNVQEIAQCAALAQVENHVELGISLKRVA